MTIKEMDEAYSNLKNEYFDIQDKYTTARQLIDCYKKDIFKLKKQLEIAKEALNEYANEDHWCGCIAGFNLRQIDSGCYGVYGFQEAQEALIKIQELEK